MKEAYFAGGCFWCITPFFNELESISSVISGYSGGDEENPTYEDVKKQKTGHRETIKIEYDESAISFEELFDIFLDHVDPFDSEGQFIDKGFSYTLAVYYQSEEEKVSADKMIKEIEQEYGKKVYISLERFKAFYDAEEYHQLFYLKNPEEFGKEMEESGRPDMSCKLPWRAIKKKQQPVNKKATENAKKLLLYLEECAGKRIICGQHTQTIPMEELKYIEEVTGKQPKLRGYELLAYSPNINYADASEPCLTEIYENRGTLEEALKWGRTGEGIITFSYHWYSPVGGRDKSFYAEYTDFDPEKVLVDGTKERNAFFSDMEKMASLLRPFAEEDIPILWRPFHESDGTWFWWGRKGPKVACELYKLMFEYFVNEKHLDNLLWVWNCALPEGWPGDEYVDVTSIDVYLQEYEPTDYANEYEKLVNATSRNKVAALAEVGYIPDIELLEKSHIPFAYYMCWSKEFCIGEQYNKRQQLKRMYDSSYSVKL